MDFLVLNSLSQETGGRKVTSNIEWGSNVLKTFFALFLKINVIFGTGIYCTDNIVYKERVSSMGGAH